MVAGAVLGLVGFSLIALSSLLSPSAHRRSERWHWLLGWLLNGPGMLAIASSWLLLALSPPRVSAAALPWLGGLATAGAALVYAASASHAGRLRTPGRYAHALATDGIYSVVRHPQALSLCLLTVGLGLLSRSLPFLVSLPVWIAAWAFYTWLEERLELRPLFGRAYERYMESTPRLWPGGRRLMRLVRGVGSRRRTAKDGEATGDAGGRE